jgi:hypothetical protein
MRTLTPRPKERRRVPIPPDLRESLRELAELIEEAKHDPEVLPGYDDAIQFPRLCGGMLGKKHRPFVLTYFPEDGVRVQWQLTLHASEIEDIGDGVQTELLLYCCADPECGCKFREADDHCFVCDYTETKEASG